MVAVRARLPRPAAPARAWRRRCPTRRSARSSCGSPRRRRASSSSASIAITYLGPTLAPGLLIAGLGLTRAAPELARLPDGARLAALAVALGRDRRSFTPATTSPPGSRARRSPRPPPRSAPEGWTPGDRLYVVNRGLWLYGALDCAAADAASSIPATRCATSRIAAPADRRDPRVSRPRFVVVADRRIHYVCEQADRWRAVDGALPPTTAASPIPLARSTPYDVYEAITPLPVR